MTIVKKIIKMDLSYETKCPLLRTGKQLINSQLMLIYDL